ncbi:MAG: hypothetical protein K2N03_04260 [Muribaculaceae bacterium]|nr:hypothetical protein [Muribaculaceae bacterium]
MVVEYQISEEDYDTFQYQVSTPDNDNEIVLVIPDWFMDRFGNNPEIWQLRSNHKVVRKSEEHSAVNTVACDTSDSVVRYYDINGIELTEGAVGSKHETIIEKRGNRGIKVIKK